MYGSSGSNFYSGQQSSQGQVFTKLKQGKSILRDILPYRQEKTMNPFLRNKSEEKIMPTVKMMQISVRNIF